MITVHKLILDPTKTTYDLPEGAEILSAREQHGDVCVWYKCDTAKPAAVRRFYVFGTGHAIPDDAAPRLQFIGTAHLSSGSLVFHVFELLPLACWKPIR